MVKSIAVIALFATLLISSSAWGNFEDQIEKITKLANTQDSQWMSLIKDAAKLMEDMLPEDSAELQQLLNTPNLLDLIKERFTTGYKADYSILNCSVGDKRDFFKFTSWPVGQLGQNVKSQQSIELESMPDDCFAHVTVDFKLTGKNSYEVTFLPTGKKNLTLCSSTYTLASSRAMTKPMVITQKTTITVNDAEDEKMTSIHNFGLYVYRACDSVNNMLPDLYLTLLLFVGGLSSNPNIPQFGSHPATWQNKLNPEFIFNGNTYEWRKRKNTFVDLDETEVKSGDFIIITRMDGVDQLIQWGAGSIVGHSVTLLEFDGEMYAVESQDGWYWPKHGIQRNPWKQWKTWANNAGFNVAILPLSDEQRAKFNLTAAVNFFKSLEGYPYGYHNFLFGWIDKVTENIPPITTINYLFVLFSALERVAPGPVVSFMGEALNKRLNTTNLTLYQITNVLYERNMTIEQLFNIPEQDGWIYSDGPSYVCSAFVAGVYKAAGLFENITIQATEFTPRDVYQLNFYNATGKPAKCAGVDNDLPYCQIMGKFKMDITGDAWNTKAPYQNMFERCPSMPPKYERPDNC